MKTKEEKAAYNKEYNEKNKEKMDNIDRGSRNRDPAACLRQETGKNLLQDNEGRARQHHLHDLRDRHSQRGNVRGRGQPDLRQHPGHFRGLQL